MLKLAAALFLLAPSAPLIDDLAVLQDAFGQARTAEARSALLDKIAALHTDDNSTAVTAAVVIGLEDDEPQVRAHAAGLLARGMDHEIAVIALASQVKGLAAFEKRVMKLLKTKLKGPGLAGNKQDTLDELDRFIAQMEERDEALKELRAYQGVIVDALAAYPDDRSVEALGDLMGGKLRFHTDRVFEALVTFGSGPAIAHALVAIDRDADSIDERAKERSKLAKQRMERQPEDWRGSKANWKLRERRRIDGILAEHDAVTAKVEAAGAAKLGLLTAFAKERDLPAPPTKLDYRKIKRWLKEIRPLLPESLNG